MQTKICNAPIGSNIAIKSECININKNYNFMVTGGEQTVKTSHSFKFSITVKNFPCLRI